MSPLAQPLSAFQESLRSMELVNISIPRNMLAMHEHTRSMLFSVLRPFGTRVVSAARKLLICAQGRQETEH
jgi:hypothetical protein